MGAVSGAASALSQLALLCWVLDHLWFAAVVPVMKGMDLILHYLYLFLLVMY